MDRTLPQNIQRLVRENDKYADAEAYSSKISTGNQVAQWHQSKFQQAGRGFDCSVGEKGLRQDASAIQRNPTSAKDMIEQELYVADRAVKVERKARLRELLEREVVQYEMELNDMGLAIAKNRD
ncbi:hypothetical protein BSKO_09181 [Bryopsis sp. KO-2023]|nr:hypothetical protein BSKO_09181 [Bryopsis sp. KO-2023]